MCHLPKQIVFFLLFTLLLSLTACSPSLPSTNGHGLASSNGQSEAEGFLSSSHSVSSGEQDGIEGSSVSSSEEHTAIDNFYPAAMAIPDSEIISEDSLYQWNQDGTLTFQNKNALHTLSAENKLLETVTLPEEALPQDIGYSLVWNNNLILALNTGWAEETPFSVVYFTDDGGVHLANLTLFNRQGELIRQYPQTQVYGYNEAGEYVDYLPVSENTAVIGSSRLDDGRPIYWLDEETAIFNCHSRVVLYNFSTDTGKILDDMSDLVGKHGKFGVYYGADSMQCGVIDGSFYYLAHRDEEKANRVGTIWKADKNGAVQLFDGMEFYHLFVGNKTLTVVSHTDSEDIEQVYCADTETLGLKEVLRGKPSISFVDNGRISFCNQYGQENSTLFSYDYETGELFTHELSDILQINLFFTQQIDDSLLWYYTVWKNGEAADYVYDSRTGETKELPEGCLGKFLSISPNESSQTSFLEYDPEARALRVRQFIYE